MSYGTIFASLYVPTAVPRRCPERCKLTRQNRIRSTRTTSENVSAGAIWRGLVCLCTGECSLRTFLKIIKLIDFGVAAACRASHVVPQSASTGMSW